MNQNPDVGVRRPARLDAAGPHHDHDVTRHQTPEQRLLASDEISRPDRHPDDAPSTDLRNREPLLDQGIERRFPVPALPIGVESQHVHLPVPFFPVEKPAPPVQTRRRIRSEEHVG